MNEEQNNELYCVDEVAPFTQEQFDFLLKRGRRRRSELYGNWVVEMEIERKLRELAETYHTGCNAYDKRVCSGISPRTGEAMPLTPDESRLSNRHAQEMRDWAIAKGCQLGFTSKQVEEAIRKWIR